MESRLWQLILEDRQIICAITDRSLRVVAVWGALDAVCPLQQDWLGRSLVDLMPESIGSEQALHAILDGSLDRFQLPWVNRVTEAGRTVYLTMVDLPYRDRQGEIVGLAHIVQDVTETGELEQRLVQRRNDLRLLQDRLVRQNLELAAANAELERLDALKSQFVSIAAHELRSPLSSIIGYVEMLLDRDFGPLTDRQAEFLGIVEDSGQRLLTITDNLLDMARIEAGRINLVLQPQDLSSLVRVVASELRPQLEAKRQRLELDLPAGLPDAWCDGERAHQIVSNLLSNAIKYTPHEGSIVISVARADEDAFLDVSVRDNGVGIAAEDQAQLYSRFFRAETATLTHASGAGLGLNIVRSLVELHGGRIWFESELHQGSTFHVTFPIAEDAQGHGPELPPDRGS